MYPAAANMRSSATTAANRTPPPKPVVPYSSNNTVATTSKHAPSEARMRTECSANRSRNEIGGRDGATGAAARRGGGASENRPHLARQTDRAGAAAVASSA